MTGERVAGLVLAAGAGSRLGTPKALVDVDGEPLVVGAIRRLAASGCSPIVVVLGASATQVREAVDVTRADVLVNDEWQAGLASSFRAGLEALHGRADAVAITLVDQPGTTVDAVEAVIAAWRTADRPAAAAVFDGVQRPPVVLAARVWKEAAAAATGESGAQVWLRAHPGLVTEVPCDDLADLADIDTPADLARLRRRRQA